MFPNLPRMESLKLASHLRILRNSLAAKAIVTAPTAEEVEVAVLLAQMEQIESVVVSKIFYFQPAKLGEMIHLD